MIKTFIRPTNDNSRNDYRHSCSSVVLSYQCVGAGVGAKYGEVSSYPGSMPSSGGSGTLGHSGSTSLDGAISGLNLRSVRWARLYGFEAVVTT